MNEYPRETVEFVPVVVTVGGQPVTAGVEFSTTEATARPTVWEPAVTIGAAIGVMAAGRHTRAAHRLGPRHRHPGNPGRAVRKLHRHLIHSTTKPPAGSLTGSGRGLFVVCGGSARILDHALIHPGEWTPRATSPP